MGRPYEIAILSGKGGTGKTSITAAFAAFASNTVFVDCDVDAADLHLIFSPENYHHETFPSGAKAVIDPEKCKNCGLCRKLCRFNAIEEIKDAFVIDEFTCEGCGLCSEACPEGAITIEEYEKNHIYFSESRFGPMVYGKLGIAEENSGKLVSQVRIYAKNIALKNDSNYILIDGPPGIGCPVISSVTGTDAIIAITEPTLSGWHDLLRLIEMTNRFHSRIFVVLNKYDLNEEMAAKIEKELKKIKIPLLGKIPYNETMIDSLLEGKSITEYKPDCDISVEIKNIWEIIMSKFTEAKKDKA